MWAPLCGKHLVDPQSWMQWPRWTLCLIALEAIACSLRLATKAVCQRRRRLENVVGKDRDNTTSIWIQSHTLPHLKPHVLPSGLQRQQKRAQICLFILKTVTFTYCQQINKTQCFCLQTTAKNWLNNNSWLYANIMLANVSLKGPKTCFYLPSIQVQQYQS